MKDKLTTGIIALIVLGLIIYFNLVFMAIALAVILGILVFVHELGHFTFAKLMGVGVETFSLGFGPRVFGFRFGTTDYRISAIPLGGFVKMVGEDPAAKIKEKDKVRSFTHKSVWRRMLIVFSGPFFNILLAFIVLFGIIKFTGITELLPVAGGFPADSPAREAGMLEGDRITTLNGASIHNWEQMAAQIQASNGEPITVKVEREGQELAFTIPPTQFQTKTIFGEDITVYAIGIESGPYFRHQSLGLGATFVKSIKETAGLCVLMGKIIVKLFEGVVPLDTLGGPILVAQMAEEQAKTGILEVLFFLALFSVNLGVLNLLPIPVMDGGHLLMYIAEAIKGKPVGAKFQGVLNRIGIAILVALMVLVFYNDITRIVKLQINLRSQPVSENLVSVLNANPMPKLEQDVPPVRLVLGLKDLRKAQIGFRINGITSENLTGADEGAWNPDWVVIGKEGLLNNPLFINNNEAEQGFPVYTAQRDMGRWQSLKTANSIADFVQIIKILNQKAQNAAFNANDFLGAIAPLTDNTDLWREYAAAVLENRGN